MTYPLCRIFPNCEGIKHHNGEGPFKTSSICVSDGQVWPPPAPPHSILPPFSFSHPILLAVFLTSSFPPLLLTKCSPPDPKASGVRPKCKVHSIKDGQASVLIVSEARGIGTWEQHQVTWISSEEFTVCKLESR